MQKHIRSLILALTLLVTLTASAEADNFSNGMQQPFNWQQSWGAIDFSGSNDHGIPSAHLQPKADIRRVILTYGTQTGNLSSLHAYRIDANNDGSQDYIIDGNGYFPQYQSPSASLQICSASDGCYLSIYISGQSTNLISTAAYGAAQCPATAAANTACTASCAATQQNCPALFQYNTNTAFNEQVLQWNFMSAANYQNWASTQNQALGTAYQIRNTSPVLVALRNNTNCYLDEMNANNNRCIKYYQYDGAANGGSFVDLYSFQDNTNGNYTTRMHNAHGESSNGAPGTVMGAGFGNHLYAHQSLDIQMSNFRYTYPDNTTSAQPGFMSFHIVNNSDNDYFIPSNPPAGAPDTNPEFCSFINSALHASTHEHANSPDYTVTVAPPAPYMPPAPVPPTGYTPAPCPQEPEHLHFTQWTGTLTCPTNLTVPETIAALRLCQADNGDYRPCQACIDAQVPGYQQGCSVSQSCAADSCIFNENPAEPYIGSAALRQYNGQPTTLADCQASPPQGVWAVLYQSNGYGHANAVAEYGGCAGAFQHLCQQGNFCFAGDTMIALPDGKTQRIDAIKAGDIVLGFKKPKETLKPYKVKTVAVTPQQNLLSLNGGTLQLTPNHVVITVKGSKLPASLLKVGDVLLRGDKTKLAITSIDTVPATSTVYNLKLEDGGAGFVAGGIRVTGYAK